jgi:hypothetical protein
MRCCDSRSTHPITFVIEPSSSSVDSIISALKISSDSSAPKVHGSGTSPGAQGVGADEDDSDGSDDDDDDDDDEEEEVEEEGEAGSADSACSSDVEKCIHGRISQVTSGTCFCECSCRNSLAPTLSK